MAETSWDKYRSFISLIPFILFNIYIIKQF